MLLILFSGSTKAVNQTHEETNYATMMIAYQVVLIMIKNEFYSWKNSVVCVFEKLIFSFFVRALKLNEGWC